MSKLEKPNHCDCVSNISGEDMYMSEGFLYISDERISQMHLYGHYDYKVNYCPMCGEKVVRTG